jgi:hypothetical protein
MKKLLFIALQLLSVVLIAQSPQVINYQGIARDAAGQPIKNTVIGLKFDLRQGSATSPTVFAETQTRTTNEFGLFSTQIGNATTNGLAQINWTGGSVYLQIGIDVAGGTNYVSLGIPQQLVSVPYAMHAESVPATYTNNILTVGKQSFTLGGGSATTDIQAGTNVNVTGVYPNYTVSSTPSLSLVSPNTLSISGGNSVPLPSTTFTGSGAISIVSVTPNSYSVNVPPTDVAVTSTATTLSVTNVGTNSVSINVPTVAIVSGTSGNVTVSGAYPSYTLNSAPTLTLIGSQLSIINGGPPVTIATGTLAAVTTTVVGTGIAVASPTAGNFFTVNVPTPSYTPNGPTTISGTYPNLTVTSPTTPTVSAAGIATVSAGPNYLVGVQSPTFTNSGPTTISGTYPNLTITSPTVPVTTPNTTITPGGIAVVSNPVTNSFVVSVPSPTFTPSGPTTISGTYPNLTITSPTVGTTPTVSAAGIATVSAGPNYLVGVQSPTFTNSGPTTISGVYPNLTITSPTIATTPTVSAAGIATVSAGPNYLVGVPSPTFTNSGPTTISGTYPNLTITSPTVPVATPNTTITPGGIAAVTNPVTNSFVVSVPSPTFTPSGPTTISGTYPNLTITSPTIATTPTVSAAGIATVSAGPNYLVGVQSPTFTNSGPTTISGTYPNLTITSPTIATTPTVSAAGIATVSAGPNYLVGVQSPTFTNSGPTTISGTYPNLTITSPTIATTPTVSAAGIATVSAGPNYLVGVQSPTFTNSGPTTISGTYPNLTITSPTIATTPTVSAAGIATVSAGPNYLVGVQSPVFTNVTQNIITGTYPNYSVNTPTIANTSIALTATAAAGPSLTSSGTNSFNINIPPAANTWSLSGNAATNPATNYLGTSDAQDLVFRTNATEKMRILSAGNIGMGSTSPTENLQIERTGSAAVSLISGAANASSLYFGSSANHFLGNIRYDNSNNSMNFWTNNTPNRLVILNNGNVGIGTSTPSASLTVLGNFDAGIGNVVNHSQSMAMGSGNTVSGAVSAAIGSTNTVVGNRSFAFGNFSSVPNLGSMAFGDWGGGAPTTLASSTDNEFSTRFDGGYRFFTDAAVTPATGVFFSAVGNVGIGTVAPTKKLEVSPHLSGVSANNEGDATFYHHSSAGAAIFAESNLAGNASGSGTSYARAMLAGYHSNVPIGTGNTGVWGVATGTGAAGGYGVVASYGPFGAPTTYAGLGGQTYPAIFMGGNVGIGTLAPSYKLSLFGTAASALNGPNLSFVTSEDIYPTMHFLNYNHAEQWMMFNAYYDGGFKSSSAISNFALATQNYGTNALHFKYKSGVAQGGNISWSDAMVINSAGNIGIGTTAPIYGLDYKYNASIFMSEFENTNTGTGADGIKITLNAATPVTSAYWIGCYANAGSSLDGGVRADGTGGVFFATTSDLRLKRNIKKYENTLSVIEKLEPKEYEFNRAPGVIRYGFIAQDLEKVYPMAVSGSSEGDPNTDPMTVDYSRLVPLLTGGIKELNELVKKQAAEIEIMKKQIEDLKKK